LSNYDLDAQQQRQQQEQEQEQEGEPRVYDITAGLKSEHTKRAYSKAFDRFLKTTIKSDDCRALLDTKQSVIESKIIDHITYLKDVQHLSCLSIEVHLSGIFHFFEMNDYYLNTKKIKRFLPEHESDYYARDRPYSTNEIERILSKCDVRARAVVLLMTSAGMRIDGLRDLRIGDIKKMDEFSIYLIWVYNRSMKDRYYTFCTPEAAKAVDEYLEYRKSLGEKLKDNSPLIRERFNIGEKPPRFLSPRMLSFIFEDVLKKARVNQPPIGKPKWKKRDVMRSHGFRKFFITQCDKANINFTVREYLSGHRLPNQDASYIRTTEEDRLTEYAKAIDLLTISPENRLRKQVAEQESTIHKLAEKDKQIEEMVRKQEQFEQLIQSLIDSGQLKSLGN
jgi:integrase